MYIHGDVSKAGACCMRSTHRYLILFMGVWEARATFDEPLATCRCLFSLPLPFFRFAFGVARYILCLLFCFFCLCVCLSQCLCLSLYVSICLSVSLSYLRLFRLLSRFYVFLRLGLSLGCLLHHRVPHVWNAQGYNGIAALPFFDAIDPSEVISFLCV